MEAEVSGSKVSSDGKITLGWKAKIGSCRSESILPFIDTYADGPNWLAAIAAPLVRTCCMPCQLRSVPSNLSKCTEKETRCSGALNSGENAYFVSRTFCSHLLNWCSFSANKSSPVQGKCLPVKQHPDAMVIMVLVGWEDEDKAWRINGKVMTLSWGWMQLLPRLNKREVQCIPMQAPPEKGNGHLAPAMAGDRPLINSKISYASTQTFY